MSEGNYTYPVVFTLLGLWLNKLVDEGESISLDNVFNEIENKTVWNLLDEKTNGRTKFYNELQREELSNYFFTAAQNDANDRSLVNNNGYCLLIAYLLDAVVDKGAGMVTLFDSKNEKI